jgi:hypothetical protein
MMMMFFLLNLFISIFFSFLAAWTRAVLFCRVCRTSFSRRRFGRHEQAQLHGKGKSFFFYYFPFFFFFFFFVIIWIVSLRLICSDDVVK